MIDAIWRAKHGQEAPDKAPVRPVVKSEAVKAGKTETRQQKWRRLHPEKYRESQKKLMARMRANARNPTSAIFVEREGDR